jgi:tetratricopeptide (TPR) repeat protein
MAIVGSMSARTRTYLLVALAALAAAGLAIGTVAFTRTSTGGKAATETTGAARGRPPPLSLDLGLRTDREAQALRRANRLYAAGKRRQAAGIFARYDSLPAQIGAALAAWPRGSLERLERLALEHPRSGVVLLHLGLARIALGRSGAAEAAWRQALARDPDTESAVQAESLLVPAMAPGRPPFIPSFAPPRQLQRLAAPQQLRALARAARSGDVRARLLYGAALQRLGLPVSAEREFAAAAARAPSDPEALTAAAVGRFTKADPAAAFSRLGPLARRFPRSQTVRFHLGELLLWLREVEKAKEELRLARSAGPRTTLGRTANAFLVQLSRLGPTG